MRALCLDPTLAGGTAVFLGTPWCWGPWGSCCPELLLSRHFPAVVRKLQEFELPYVSVTSLHNPEFQIILRKR